MLVDKPARGLQALNTAAVDRRASRGRRHWEGASVRFIVSRGDDDRRTDRQRLSSSRGGSSTAAVADGLVGHLPSVGNDEGPRSVVGVLVITATAGARHGQTGRQSNATKATKTGWCWCWCCVFAESLSLSFLRPFLTQLTTRAAPSTQTPHISIHSVSRVILHWPCPLPLAS